MRSICPSAKRHSIVRFWSSAKPMSRNAETIHFLPIEVDSTSEPI